MRIRRVRNPEDGHEYFTIGRRWYDVDALLADQRGKPTRRYRTSRLAPMLDYEPPEAGRTRKPDLRRPIVLATVDGGRVVVDGVHRLDKAVRQDRPYILGRSITERELEKYRIRKPKDVA